MSILMMGNNSKHGRALSVTLNPSPETGELPTTRCASSWGDNAVSESFNSTLQFELLRRRHFATREQARHAVAEFTDEYNTDRRHSTNGMLSPVDYEHQCATRCATEQGIGRTQRTEAPHEPRRDRLAADDLSIGAAPGYGPVPPASRVAAAIAARRACGPPLTPEPRRPPSRSSTGRRTALPAGHAAPNTNNQDQIPTTKSQGIASQVKLTACSA